MILFSLLLHLTNAIIPKNLLPLANKALESVKYRSLMKENRTHLMEPGFYEKKGAKFRIAKSLFGPPAKEIKGHAYENNYLALVPNKKYKLSQNFTNSAFALDQKMYILENIAGSDEFVSIYQVKEINPYHVITEVIMYTTDDKTGDDDSGSTIRKTANFNWDDESNMPVFRPLISSFPNLKFGMGTKVTASASARLHSRGTNYLQLDMTFKIKGSFGAGIQTISGKQFLDDYAIYDNEIPIWGTSIQLFNFEFKSGLFAYIDASIVDIGLETAINFTFLHGYNFEAYNRIIVCTGFPSPGYTTTGWRSTAEKIDTINDARQNGPQDSYQTTITFTPRVDIGVKLGLEMSGSTSSWLRAGVRGEVNFMFGADPVMCDFPYLYGKIEPVVSLFVAYDGLNLFGFSVAPSFERTWELFRKTVFNKECAFLDVQVSPDYATSKSCKWDSSYRIIQMKKLESRIQDLAVPIYGAPRDYSPWKSHQTSNFKPILISTWPSCFSFTYLSNGLFGQYGLYEWDKQCFEKDNISGNVYINNSYFEAEYSYSLVGNETLSSACMAYSEQDTFSLFYHPDPYYAEKFGVIQADLEGGFRLLQEDEVEYFDEGTPNDGLKNSGIPNLHLFIGSYIGLFELKKSEDLNKVKIETYIKHNNSETQQYLTTIYFDHNSKAITYLPLKRLGYEINYVFYVYVNDTLVANETLSSFWHDFADHNNPKKFIIDGLTINLPDCDMNPVIIKIKKKELVGPKRYVVIPVREVEIENPYISNYKPFEVGSKYRYFLLTMKIKSDKSQKPCYDYINSSTNFAILLKCPGCFPLCKHCETIDNGYYLIKLTINETINFNNNYDVITIPMCSIEPDGIKEKFTLTHFFILNNEGSTQCTNNTYFTPVGFNTGSYFMNACLTPTIEASTWNATYKNSSIISNHTYQLNVIAELENRGMSLISFERVENETANSKTILDDSNVITDDNDNKNEISYPDLSILVTKECLVYPDNTSNYKVPDIITSFRTERCYRLYVNKDGKEVDLQRQSEHQFLYDPKGNSTNEEIDIICSCKYKEYAFCEISYYNDLNGYYLLESQAADGITITKPCRFSDSPRGQVKREVIFMYRPDFSYTKTWEGNLKSYFLVNQPDTYKITVQITVPNDKPDYRRIQLLMNGGDFKNYPIGFDIFKYMDDPLDFLNKINLDVEAEPGWIYLGEDHELYISIDVEPKFTKDWCNAAATLSPLPDDIVSHDYQIDCGKGMKWKKGTCVVNHKLSWKFWVVIASIVVAAILIIVIIVVIIRKVCC